MALDDPLGAPMTDIPTCDWPGKSGRKYRYWVYKLPADFGAQPGNYIFARLDQSGTSWNPLYIGQTGDLAERFDDHHAMPCIRNNGTTHIHVHKSPDDEDQRRAEETDLINNFAPPCNKT